MKVRVLIQKPIKQKAGLGRDFTSTSIEACPLDLYPRDFFSDLIDLRVENVT